LLKERFGDVPKDITQYAMIAKVAVTDGHIARVAYHPCFFDQELQPELLSRDDPRAQTVFDYYQKISRSQGLDTRFSWDGDEIVIHID
jgi:hypothetical protein